VMALDASSLVVIGKGRIAAAFAVDDPGQVVVNFSTEEILI